MPMDNFTRFGGDPKSRVAVTFDPEQLTIVCASMIAAGIWANPSSIRLTFNEVASDAIDQAREIRKLVRETHI